MGERVTVVHEAQEVDSALGLNVNEDGWLSVTSNWQSGDLLY